MIMIPIARNTHTIAHAATANHPSGIGLTPVQRPAVAGSFHALAACERIV